MLTSEMLPAPRTTDSILAEYMAMTDTSHRESIHSLKGEIGERLLRLGKAVYAWKMKGYNLDELGMNGMTHWLLMIGGDELYAPLLAKTMRDKKLTAKLSRLCYADQKHIGDGGTVDMLLLSSDGKEDILQVSPIAIEDPEQLGQILGDKKIRTATEQRLWIEANRAKAAKPITERVGYYSDFDGVTATCKIGRYSVGVDMMRQALRTLERAIEKEKR